MSTRMDRKSLKSLFFVVWSGATLVCLLLPAAAAGPEQWRQATAPREWKFPRDHGAHPAYRTEWWYFTGNLNDGQGNAFGYQLTFFRQGIRLHAADPADPWSVRDLYLAHFSVTDVAKKRFIFDEAVSRTGPGLAVSAGKRSRCPAPRLVGQDERGGGPSSGKGKHCLACP